jgi:hypothetical protein
MFHVPPLVAGKVLLLFKLYLHPGGDALHINTFSLLPGRQALQI